MATLNDLLQILLTHSADSLQLHSDQPPALFIERELHLLPHPPLPGESLEKFLRELLDGRQIEQLGAQRSFTDYYDTETLGRFRFRVRRIRDGWSVVFRPTAALSSMNGSMSASTDTSASLDESLNSPWAAVVTTTDAEAETYSRTDHVTAQYAVIDDAAMAAAATGGGPVTTKMSAEAVARVSALETEGATTPGPPYPQASRGGARRPPHDTLGPTPGPPYPRAVPTDPMGRPTTIDGIPSPRSIGPSTTRPSGRSNITTLLEYGISKGASDLVVSSGTNATIRIAGEFRPLKGAIFYDQDILETFKPYFTEKRRATLERTGSLDLAYELPRPNAPPQRFRANIFRQMRGFSAAFRPIRDTIPAFDELELPPTMTELAEYPFGLVLVTGPTGSGKSTTLSAMIGHINGTKARHIITLEDPIEFVFQRKRSLVHQREIGVHVESFSSGIRAALRENPDVILVGEMRDHETIAAAISAAETGHLVFSTLHCSSAAQAVERIVNVFPEHQQTQIRTQLAGVLRAVVTQRLLPTSDGQSRVPAIEIARINYALANMIRERKTHMFASQLQTAKADGMLAFDDSLAKLVHRGRIGRETALIVAHDPQQLEKKLAG